MVALVVAVGGVAVAAIPGPDGTITACYANSDFVKSLVSPIDQFTEVATPAGSMRVVQDGQACGSGESTLKFNQRGPAGPQGAAGAAGPVRSFTGGKPFVRDNGKAKIVLRVRPGAGRYLVIATAPYHYSSLRVVKGDLSCQLMRDQERPALGSGEVNWRDDGAKGTIPIAAAVTLTANQRLILDCFLTLSRDKKRATTITQVSEPRIVLIKVGS